MRTIIASMGVGFFALVILVLAGIGAATACFSLAANVSPDPGRSLGTATPSAVVRAPTLPAPTSTPFAEPTQTPTSIPQPTSTPVEIPATPTIARPAASATPVPVPPTAAPPPANVNFSGSWRVIDVVTQGQGTGQTFTFDITLQQTGTTLAGGNSGIVMAGTVSGATAQVSYQQPALGYSGTFTWTMGAGSASGTFTNSLPNSGTSQLVRLQ